MTEILKFSRPLTRSVLRVGAGRGFVVACENCLGFADKVVITAAHCLEHAVLANGDEGCRCAIQREG
jgi:hypothetical protein